jgi:signal transduction histidine kinase
MNLGLNGKDAMPEGGVLRLSTAHSSDGWVQVRVADTGTGMTAETRARMFDPFFTTKEEGKGTGLGLSMVFGIMKAHGGSVEVESELGRGTTFTLSLPADPGQAPPPQE